MSVRNVVKVMNFHALLRVNNARKKVERAFSYERELKYVIASIVKNRIFKQDNLSLEFSKNEKELNIYIGSDLGFCSSFNADVTSFIKEDSDENDKIIDIKIREIAGKHYPENNYYVYYNIFYHHFQHYFNIINYFFH